MLSFVFKGKCKERYLYDLLDHKMYPSDRFTLFDDHVIEGVDFFPYAHLQETLEPTTPFAKKRVTVYKSLSFSIFSFLFSLEMVRCKN